ncbi:hypothetical protein KI387_014245, partial [Taxus chinensis]
MEEQEPERSAYGGEKSVVDECLAGAGYNVRPSDLRQVAHKLERLEMALDGEDVTRLSTDAVHYNPSDLGGWIDSMLHELSTPTAVGTHGLLAENGGAQDEIEDPGFEYLPEAAGFLNEEDHNVDGLFGLLGGSTDDDDDDDDEALMEVPLICNIREQQQGQEQVEKEDRPYDLRLPDLLKVPELHEPYLRLKQAQSSSCSSASTDENFKLGQCSASSVQGIEPQQPDQTDDMINDIDSYIHDIDPDASDTAQPLFNPQQVEGSSPAVEECAPGVRLVHTLMACAEAVQRNNVGAAQEMLKQIKLLSSSTGGAMEKIAQYFSEALLRRIYGFSIRDAMYLKNDSLSELLHIYFYENCPYLKFAHFTANQAILEAFQGHKRVHVIDFSLKQGIQWPALIQALALRPGGPPALRLTGIGPPHPEGNDVLHEVGLKLAQLADSVNVEFDFRGYVAASLSDIKPWMLDVRPGETLAVNSIFQLHRLVFTPDRIPPPVASVLDAIRTLNPKIITIVEQEASHNSPVFLERFTKALHYYSTMFDSLETRRLSTQSYPQVMSEMYLAREICNIVACEGHERVERHETLMQWRMRMHTAGFRPLHLGSNAFKQA